MLRKTLSGKPAVSVVIPTRNSLELVKKTIAALLKINSRKITEIVVVDDCSNYPTGSVLKKEFPEIRLFRHSAKRGFAAAANTGARSSIGNLIAFIPPGCVPAKYFLSDLDKYFSDQSIFGVSLHAKNESWQKGSFDHGFVRYSAGERSNKVHEAFFVPVDGGIFRRAYWMKLGGLNEKDYFGNTWKEVDLSFRAAKRGLISLWFPYADIQKKTEVKTSNSNFKNIMKFYDVDQLTFQWKNLTSKSIIKKHIRGIPRRLVKSPSYLIAMFIALGKLRLILKLRKREIKEAKISDEAIFAKFNNA